LSCSPQYCKIRPKKLDFDVESLILKICLEFCTSTKKVSELKNFFEKDDIEFSETLRQMTTRWLSLSSSVDRLIENWISIKKYFHEKGKDKTSNIIWKFVEKESESLTLEVCFVYFVQQFMNIFLQSLYIL
jgi:hypothetical protein